MSSGSITVGETSRGSVTVLERWMNLAPVNDFCVVEDGSGGSVSRLYALRDHQLIQQTHLIVASGASNASTLRSVRSGAGLEQRLHIEGIEGVERMWSIASGR